MRAKLVIIASCAVALTLVAVAPAGAIVPPKDCDEVTVRDREYTIKADQMRCRTARRYSRRYLRSHDRPSGYRCKDYGRETKLKFRCSRSVRVFFAIRR